jgi:hypothetical protein
MDFFILLLPAKLIFSIPRSWREKIGVYAVFGLGILSTICAIIRFHYLIVVPQSEDPYFDSIYINIWSMVEINVGILCACLPTLRPLFSRAQRNRTREALNISLKPSSREGSKRGGIMQTKEMFISITAGTIHSAKSTLDTLKSGRRNTFRTNKALSRGSERGSYARSSYERSSIEKGFFEKDFDMMEDYPPPVPPKDEKRSLSSPKTTVPDLAHVKV